MPSGLCVSNGILFFSPREELLRLVLWQNRKKQQQQQTMAFFAVPKQNGSADEFRTDIQNWAISRSTRAQPSSKQVSNNGLKGEQDTRALVQTIWQLCVRFICPIVLKICIKHGGITAVLCAKFQNEQQSNKLWLNVTSRDFHDDVIKWKHFRVTGHLCGEFTGPRWIPRRKASGAELLCFLWSAPVSDGHPILHKDPLANILTIMARHQINGCNEGWRGRGEGQNTVIHTNPNMKYYFRFTATTHHIRTSSPSTQA